MATTVAGAGSGYRVIKFDGAGSRLRVVWDTDLSVAVAGGPTNQIIVIDLATGGASSGTASFTEGADGLVGAGRVTTTGTSAFTEGADGLVGAGRVTTTGTAAFTEGADGVVGAGRVTTTGAGSLTEGADGVVGAGSTGSTSTGTAAFTEGADGIVGSGFSTTPPTVLVAVLRTSYDIDNKTTHVVSNARTYTFDS